MGQLILYDADGVPLGSRPMASDERLFYYKALDQHDLIEHAGQRYHLVTVAWRVPEEDLRCLVVCEGPVPIAYDD